MSKINQLARRIVRFDLFILGFLALVFVLPTTGWLVGHMGLWLLEKGYLFLLFIGRAIKGAFLYGRYILENGFDISKQACVDFCNFIVAQVLNIISHISLYIPKLQFVGGSYILAKMGFGILLFLVSFGIHWIVKNLSWIRNREGVDFSFVFFVSFVVVVISSFGTAFLYLELNHMPYFFLSVSGLSLLWSFLLQFFTFRNASRIKKWREECGLESPQRRPAGYFIKFKGWDKGRFIKAGELKDSFLVLLDSDYFVFAEDFYVKEQVIKAVADIKKVIDGRANKENI